MNTVKAVLNNNAVLAATESGQEFIAYGRGIGYKHRKNDHIRDSEILRRYIGMNNKQQQDLVRLFEEIDYDVIRLTEMIIEMAEKRLAKKLSPYLLINLADHISFSIQRYRQGLAIPLFVSEEIKRFYRVEYDVGAKATEMINQHYDIHLDETEASSIAFHIINASEGQSIDDIRRVMTYVDGVIRIINAHLEDPITRASPDLDRMVLHLRYFFRNILSNKTQTAPSSEMDSTEMLSVLVSKDPLYEEVIQGVDKYVKDKLDYHLTNEDKLYLVIHLRRVFTRRDSNGNV